MVFIPISSDFFLGGGGGDKKSFTIVFLKRKVNSKTSIKLSNGHYGLLLN